MSLCACVWGGGGLDLGPWWGVRSVIHMLLCPDALVWFVKMQRRESLKRNLLEGGDEDEEGKAPGADDVRTTDMVTHLGIDLGLEQSGRCSSSSSPLRRDVVLPVC